jgi:hypothetical protein
MGLGASKHIALQGMAWTHLLGLHFFPNQPLRGGAFGQ